MLPTPAASRENLISAQPPATSFPIMSSKGHLEPHISNLPRRRRQTQLPSPDTDSSSDDIPDSTSTVASSPTSSFASREASMPVLDAFAATSSSDSSLPLLQPAGALPIGLQSRNLLPKGHLQPHASNLPRRPRPVEVLPGSGVFSVPSAQEADDSGVPCSEFRTKGSCRADVMARALFALCAAQPEKHDEVVSETYMRLHDLGQVPFTWMGALRHEGLQVVGEELFKATLP
ncbi:hypothetical protein CYLTODRAFT_426532 [Cylindrobasidium torrendii FP15055 ss-10]|uniref:Uncharacterized protein n=1 Tax=Cylindrobasidium torrendii FP15055 ss-10 TaxID=1314674 RepID=A0A0D7AYF7_9AGAR|nr:hypothetical protein CYLTODRAFT_426532 [Cylindrobasidium torrendii FP15055 ss-10]